ncbi:hypothetical protein CPC08DRAFT_779954 [Agrocybe pediades]|nr:hypothetical protein CPC08DRAFT_779954 [Agrocybe pediades]
MCLFLIFYSLPSQKHPLDFWIPHIDSYVDELLRHEGCGSASKTECGTCNKPMQNDQRFRCVDCQSAALHCQSCTVQIHRHLPLHRIEKWTDTHFQRTNLKELGLRMQLGHIDKCCPLPEPAFNDDFVIIAVNGIHRVGLDYCGCSCAPSKPIQLLRERLFPSTVIDPKTAATFDVLDNFQLLSFTSQVSAYDFYHTIAKTTDNTGINAPQDHFPIFLRIICEWRLVRLLKRSGRGHSSSGVNGTAEGECAVICPACPYPGRNLPEDWKTRPEKEKWLYTLYTAMDANFRLKRMNVSNDERDPGLNHGYSYMVERKKFKEYLKVYDTKIVDEKSNCNNHDAIKSASARGGHGTAVSGAGAVVCARHDMKRPLGVGDLQKGERYVNMDYFFLSSIAKAGLERIVLSYDIACQWSINLLSRCAIYPPNVLSTAACSSEPINMVYVVPKFHLPAHVLKCQTAFSFNFTPRVGRTDGEAPERGWPASNNLSGSTKEMGPGSRSDTLDDHFGHHSWRKVVTMAETFLRRAKDALEGRQEHLEAFIEFDAAIPPEDATVWTRMCQAWEKDPKQVNPFVLNRKVGVSDSDVRLRLAQEESDALARGEAVTVHGDVSPSVLVSQGLHLEDQQARLALDMKSLGTHSTSLQKAKLLERSNALKRRIDAWIAISIAILRSRDDAKCTTPVAVSDIKLFLPSSSKETLACSQSLLTYEWEFRFAQAHDILNSIRGLLLLRAHMINSKQSHSRGQRMQTRSLKLLNSVSTKISALTAAYSHTRTALEQLSIPLEKMTWQSMLRPLDQSDLVALYSTDDSVRLGEGRRTLPWIWKVDGTGENADDRTQAALRVEWCKARARAHRWQEECLLLAEEMRRVKAYFSWEEQTWLSKADEVKGSLIDAGCMEPTSEGKYAYAIRQSEIRKSMRLRCEDLWDGLADQLTTIPDRDDAYTMVECH